MKNLTILVLAVFAAVLFIVASSAYAGCPMMAKAATAGSGGIVNDTCPVMGGPVSKDTPYTAEYKGNKVGFCCPQCVEKFNASPKKYIGNLKEKEG